MGALLMMSKPLVEQLDYAGSGPDEGCGFIEILVVQTSQGEKYLAHRGYEVENGFMHEKIEFPTKEAAVLAFPFSPQTTFSALKSSWKETTPSCGYDIPRAEFESARLRRYEQERVRWNSQAASGIEEEDD